MTEIVSEQDPGAPAVVERIFPVVGTVDKKTQSIHGPQTAVVVEVERDRVVVLSRSPRLILYPRFITSQESTEIMTIASSRFTSSMIGRGGADVRRTQARTSLTAYLDHHEAPVLSDIIGRASRVMGFPVANIERFQVTHYSPGEYYKPHWDCYDIDTPEGERAIAAGYQRVATLLVYLYVPITPSGSDVDADAHATNGHTLFPLLGVSVAPLTCGAVFFDNACPQTLQQYDAALHAGQPVTHGEKWVLNIWAHARDVSGLESFENEAAKAAKAAETNRDTEDATAAADAASTTTAEERGGGGDGGDAGAAITAPGGVAAASATGGPSDGDCDAAIPTT